MIINTGQRTDIPAFYSRWFINRIKQGYVLVRNPYYPTLVTKFILDPKVVDVIGFCTKNPRPMIPYLDEIKDYGQFWYITITSFGRDLEPNVPSINEVISDFKYLSNKLGKTKVSWRYTPIIINDKYTLEYHIKAFKYIASSLDGYTELVAFGFLDVYPKLKKNHPELQDMPDDIKIIIAKEFQKIAKEHHMALRLCSKEKWLKDYGIDVDGCMRIEDYERSINKKLNVKKKMEARKGYCACYLSNDIGTYNSCPHLCKYCYANGDKDLVLKNYKLHDENSPLLIGHINSDDKIRNATQESFIDNMVTLF